MKIVGSLFLIILLVLSGCSGVSVVGYPMQGDHYRVQRTITDTNPFATNQQRSWLEQCANKDASTGEYTGCTQEGDIQVTASPGFMNFLAPAVLYSGAIVGAGALIGNGLADSGSTTTNTNVNGASVSKSHPQTPANRH